LNSGDTILGLTTTNNKLNAIAKKIGQAQALAALENLAKQLGGEGLEFWEKLGSEPDLTDKPDNQD